MRAVNAIIDGLEAGGAVTVDGRILGEAPVHAVLSADGVSYVGLHPAMPRAYGVTRRLEFCEGRLVYCPPDVEAWDWGGGLYELSLRCGILPAERERRFPFTVARCAFMGAEAVLYWEDGLWLSLEKGGRVQTGFFLEADAAAGELIIRGRLLAAIGHAVHDAALIVNEGFEAVQRLEAEDIAAEEDALLCRDALASPTGRQKRTRWVFEEDGVQTEWTQTGFFTGEPRPCSPALMLLDALKFGGEGEAAALLSPSLGVDEAHLRAFLGEYDVMRAHPADAARAGVGRRCDGPTKLRVLTFETDGGKIVNILEES